MPLTSKCRENLSVKAKRVKHLRSNISVMSLKIVAQMLNPYSFLFILKFRLR
jgi:hypothetical protein